MKKMVFLCIFISNYLICQQQESEQLYRAIDTLAQEFRCNCTSYCQDRQEQEELNATMTTVLHGFAAIVGGIISIMQNPHDRERVGAQVNNMVTSLVTIGVQASKSQRLSYRASESVHHYIEKLTDMIMPFILELVSECAQKIHVEAA